ncbi:EAL domain-containing protein [Pseudoalteromonas fenneropenaei]|uniref:EAL domain-containing protein n=1 Tax=Pseudoalteromonas fenneropenaei TaxID=1737459 RepID=A0ABV7CJR9_9GAMM
MLLMAGLTLVQGSMPSQFSQWMSLGSIQACLAGAVLMGLIHSLWWQDSGLIRVLHWSTAIVTLALLSTGMPWLGFVLGALLIAQLLFASQQRLTLPLKPLGGVAVSYLVLLSGYYFAALPLLLLALPGIALQLLCLHQVYCKARQQAKPAVMARQTDPLGVADRESLRQAFLTFQGLSPCPAMLVMIRLQGFQEVNLHLGRDFGDILLVQSANRLKQQLRHTEVLSIPCINSFEKVAHLGGLHFVFICKLQEHKHLHEQLLDDIFKNTLKPFNVANCTLEITARASYVSCDEADGQFEQILSLAYLALDSNPEQTVVPYQSQLQVRKQEQQSRLAELAKVDFRQEFELYFQPVVRHRDGDIEFLELLLRWQHPKQGILAANVFIDDIRIAGLSLRLAQYVIERAAELAMALQMEKRPIALSFNVFGPEMLHEEFIEFIDKVMTEHNLPQGKLIIECPAALFLSLSSQEVAMIARLKSLGVRLCVDGFGEAPLVLAKLPKLAVDYVKIGQSLTREHQQQGQFKAMVRGMVEIQQQLNSKVLCEGVETLEQLQFVKSLNTYGAQGYYFARPLSSVGMLTWLERWQAEHPVSGDQMSGLSSL